MSRKKKKSGDNSETVARLAVVTAVLSLVNVILQILHDWLTETQPGAEEGRTPPLHLG